MGMAVVSGGMSAASSGLVALNPVALDGTAVTMGTADDAGLEGFVNPQGR
jgi:hypothetical protein